MRLSCKQYLGAVAFALCVVLLFIASEVFYASDSPLPVADQAIFEPATQSAENGQRSYENTHYRFSILYPEDLRVIEYDEGGGARTITFENQGDGRGFQIFATPFESATISPELIERDVASGAMKDVAVFTVGGVDAIAFSSQNPIMGEIREVWFVRGGHLYEVVTYEPFEGWLTEILRSWQFM